MRVKLKDDSVLCELSAVKIEIAIMNNEKIENLIEKEEKLAEYEGEDRVISSHDMRDKIKEAPTNENHIFSLMPSIDKYIEGFVGGELIIIAGSTGAGKSLLAQSFTESFSNQNILSLWFSYEMQPKYFFQRFTKLPLFYLPSILQDRSMEWIEDRIIEAKVKHGVQVVMIDHLHYLIDMGKISNASLEIGQVVRDLKLIAVKNNLIIFLLCHLVKTKQFNEVSLSDIRDSSLIACEADTVMLIWRVDEQIELNSSIVKIDKQRRTGAINKKTKLVFDLGILKEIGDEEYKTEKMEQVSAKLNNNVNKINN